MGGRYALPRWNPSLAALPGPPTDWRAHWNISPANQVLMVREDAGTRRADLVHWGLTSAWLTDLSRTPSHARAEALAEQPMFRGTFRQCRCLLLVNGFYGRYGVRKCPYWVSTGERLSFSAGIWEAHPVQGQTWFSVAQVSQAAVESRRPLLLDEAEQDTWLAPDTSLSTLVSLLVKSQSNLRSVALAGFVNKPETDGSECLTPA